MSLQHDIEEILRKALAPLHLTVTNESHLHTVPPGSESHFNVVIVSKHFAGKGLIQRHRHLHALLAKELERLHALALHCYTPEEWAESAPPSSPQCLGGGHKEA